MRLHGRARWRGLRRESLQGMVLTAGGTLGAPGFLWGGCLVRQTPSLGGTPSFHLCPSPSEQGCTSHPWDSSFCAHSLSRPCFPFGFSLIGPRHSLSRRGVCVVLVSRLAHRGCRGPAQSGHLLPGALSPFGSPVSTGNPSPAGHPGVLGPPPPPPTPSTVDPDCTPFPPSAGVTRWCPAQGVCLETPRQRPQGV